MPNTAEATQTAEATKAQATLDQLEATVKELRAHLADGDSLVVEKKAAALQLSLMIYELIVRDAR